MSRNVSDTALVAAGHSSAVLATLLGVGVTVFEWSTPAYGLTVAWALAAVANGIKVERHERDWTPALQSGARVQKTLCWIGSAICASTAAFYLLQ